MSDLIAAGRIGFEAMDLFAASHQEHNHAGVLANSLRDQTEMKSARKSRRELPGLRRPVTKARTDSARLFEADAPRSSTLRSSVEGGLE